MLQNFLLIFLNSKINYFSPFLYSDYLKVAASKDTAVNLKLQEASLHHSHKADCYDYGRRRIYAVSKLKSFSRKYS